MNKAIIFILSLYFNTIKGVFIMAQILINFRLDEDIKKKMEETCQELGMNMTTAFTIFARKVAREKRIPFEISIDPFYSDTNRKAIKESIEQVKQGKVVVKTIEELEGMENE